jgi:chromosome partitioning protein
MNILAIANNKGGVGKSTSAQNIGAAIATFADKDTLLIDLDPQANLTKSLGIKLQPSQKTVGSFILGEATFNQTVIQYKESKISILPASIALIQEEERIKQDSKFPFSLINALKKGQVHQYFKFVVIDCPPALSTLTTIALVASERCYVPLQAEYFSYEGLREFINFTKQVYVTNPKLKIGGVFATRFNPYVRKNVSQDIIKKVKEQLGDKFLNTCIRENISLVEAQVNGQHIFDYNRQSHGAQDYYNLTKEIITV